MASSSQPHMNSSSMVAPMRVINFGRPWKKEFWKRWSRGKIGADPSITRISGLPRVDRVAQVRSDPKTPSQTFSREDSAQSSSTCQSRKDNRVKPPHHKPRAAYSIASRHSAIMHTLPRHMRHAHNSPRRKLPRTHQSDTRGDSLVAIW